MPDAPLRAIALGAAILLAGGCDGSVRHAHDPVNPMCIGKDSTNPPIALAAAPPTHGPGVAAPAPLQLGATGSGRRRELNVGMNITLFPMLYVFDDQAHYALRTNHAEHPALEDPLFLDVSRYEFWGEVVGDTYYENPGVNACAQTVLLGEDFDFRAPSHGLLFVQYVTPHCANCDKISAAIQHTLDTHPDLSARWVQYDLESTNASWCYKGYGFQPRRLLGNDIKDFTCPN